MPDARTRSLACAVTAAEAAGRLEEAETLWTHLGEPEQALRCRVTRLERAGQVAAAAALLEARGLLDAAARAWAQAGDPAGQGRCEARRLERQRRWAEAAALWEALGDAQAAARCRGRLLQSRRQYAAAAEAFEAAGDADAALQAARLAARAGERDRALGLARRAERRALAEEIRRARDAWLAAARPAGGRRGRAAGGPPPAPAGPRGQRARSFGPELDAVVAAVAAHPGARSAGIVALTGLPRERVQRLLRTATATGTLVKTGATRGTRYYLAGSPEVAPAPAGR